MPKKLQQKYACQICKLDCVSNVIQCFFCDLWVHSSCVSMSTELLKKWGEHDYLKYACPGCLNINDQFDFCLLLNFIKLAENKLGAAISVQLLLETYSINLPQKSDILQSEKVDETATGILKLFHPALLQENRPLSIIGDGNCLFRAISMGMFGSQKFYSELRLRTVLEMVLN